MCTSAPAPLTGKASGSDRSQKASMALCHGTSRCPAFTAVKKTDISQYVKETFIYSSGQSEVFKHYFYQVVFKLQRILIHEIDRKINFDDIGSPGESGLAGRPPQCWWLLAQDLCRFCFHHVEQNFIYFLTSFSSWKKTPFYYMLHRLTVENIDGS